MIELRPFAALGRFRNAWLDAHYHFSFADYHDPSRMGWGALRVCNDDEIAPGSGFDPHPHRDMEIITYVRRGAISHRDSLGNAGRTGAGDVQVMHAGTGIVHAEYNADAEPIHSFQIWLRPERHGLPPGWGTRHFPNRPSGELRVLASGRVGEEAERSARASPEPSAETPLPLYADAALLAGRLLPGQTATHRLDAERRAYLIAAAGSIMVNGIRLGPRDGAAISAEPSLEITAEDDAELVLLDLA